jgi:hypothetical protein
MSSCRETERGVGRQLLALGLILIQYSAFELGPGLAWPGTLNMADMRNLSEWFTSGGGSLDSAMGFADFPEDGGRGAIALRDIDVCSSSPCRRSMI